MKQSETTKREQHEQIEELIQTRLIEMLSDPKLCDDKVLSVSMRYLREFKVDTVDDVAKQASQAELRDSLPFRKAADA